MRSLVYVLISFLQLLGGNVYCQILSAPLENISPSELERINPFKKYLFNKIHFEVQNRSLFGVEDKLGNSWQFKTNFGLGRYCSFGPSFGILNTSSDDRIIQFPLGMHIQFLYPNSKCIPYVSYQNAHSFAKLFNVQNNLQYSEKATGGNYQSLETGIRLPIYNRIQVSISLGYLQSKYSHTTQYAQQQIQKYSYLTKRYYCSFGLLF